MMCGNNPFYTLLHAVIETGGELPDIPRYRDTYTMVEAGEPRIVIYTRTGGGNREEYESENSQLAAHPLFVRDFDDDFDRTFAHFCYSVPEPWKESVLRFHEFFSGHPEGLSPRQKFDNSLAAIKNEEMPHATREYSDANIDQFVAFVTNMAEKLGLCK